MYLNSEYSGLESAIIFQNKPACPYFDMLCVVLDALTEMHNNKRNCNYLLVWIAEFFVKIWISKKIVCTSSLLKIHENNYYGV